ncbi:MAG: hypothetical protein U9Q12_02070 [Patescibacteria group bacterium]|nr:hypothetical protein [Patescibacteria group bacterium]
MREMNFVKDPPPEDVKRNLQGIEKAAEWESRRLEKNNKKFNAVDIREYGPEAVAIFDKSLELVIQFLERIGINIRDLGVESFNVFVTKTEKGNSFYNSAWDKIVINESTLKDEQSAVRTIIHEIYHNLSAHALHLTQFQQEDKKYVRKIKSGFSSEYSLIEKKVRHKSIDNKELFNALNEGVTDWLTIVTIPKEQLTPSGYQGEVAIVHSLLKNVYGESDSEVKIFLESYFTGKMMHLRNIEKFYGKNSLKLLAHLNTKEYYEESYGHNEEYLEHILQWKSKVVEFFTTDDVSKREDLREKLKIDEL